MISPKEKAVELVDRMFDSISPSYKANELAKECALIAVDEVLQYSKAHGFIGLTEYYEKVKKQIIGTF
jgi:hypothetical protein